MPIDHLPRRLRRPAERLRSAMLTDGTALVILGIACVARGASYWGYDPRTGSSHPAEELMTIGLWSGVWIIIGAMLVLIAGWHDTGTAAILYGAGVALHILWALSFLRATWTGDMPRGWVSAIGYATVAALAVWSVWRGSRTEVRVEQR